MELTYGSLFTGIDAFGLAATQLGYETKYGCDISPFAQVHFREHYPNAEWYEDIKTIECVPHTTLMSFGFPCQDASIASKKETKNAIYDGKRTSLFWDAIRLVQGARPNICIVENVPPLLASGWDSVAGAFAEMRYRFGWCLIPASAFGAEFQGYRIYGVAASNSFRREEVVSVFDRVAKKVLQQKNERHKDLERKSSRAVLPEMQYQAQSGIYRDVDGIPYWLYEGQRAKALGNSVYYPIAQAIVNEVTHMILQH